MKRTRQVQFCKRDAQDWDAPEVVEDFRWEDPDVVILDAKGKEIRRLRIGAAEPHRGWRGGTIWLPEDSSPR